MSDSAIARSVNEAATPRRPRTFYSLLYGGLAVGVLDILDATTFLSLYYGLTPIRILQSVA